jgi:hypothetical protein
MEEQLEIDIDERTIKQRLYAHYFSYHYINVLSNHHLPHLYSIFKKGYKRALSTSIVFCNILSNTLTCCVMSFYDGILGIIDNWSLSCNLNSWCFK